MKRPASSLRAVAAFACTLLMLSCVALLLAVIHSAQRAGEQEGIATHCFFVPPAEQRMPREEPEAVQPLPEITGAISPSAVESPDVTVVCEMSPPELEEVEFPSFSFPEPELAAVDEALFMPRRRLSTASSRAVPPVRAVAQQDSEPKGDYTPPAYQSAPLPPYPPAMRQRGVEGTSRLRIFLDARGTPRKVELAGSSGHGELDAVARSWVLEHWTFSPARRGAVAVASTVVVQVRFVID